ncbi:hypothetical protein Taro_052549 [Colocasia esculenta]|uniref:Uncharacterized protein n=1 Tax=Colocasia esculenta TaxID=4460 RepID=A0A843XK32_COLES|nr:hypothetical protein [Colocasia esculenta]
MVAFQRSSDSQQAHSLMHSMRQKCNDMGGRLSGKHDYQDQRDTSRLNRDVWLGRDSKFNPKTDDTCSDLHAMLITQNLGHMGQRGEHETCRGHQVEENYAFGSNKFGLVRRVETEVRVGHAMVYHLQLRLEADPHSKEADPLDLGAGPLELEAVPLDLGVGLLDLEAVPLDPGAGPLDLEAVPLELEGPQLQLALS